MLAIHSIMSYDPAYQGQAALDNLERFDWGFSLSLINRKSYWGKNKEMN
jgi:hypothetical protein